ncbi:MAG: glycosyltransferase family 4 protein [Planctomycetota bacterium]
MKIALVRKDYTDKKGGAEGYIVALSRQLADMGHEIHIFAAAVDVPEHRGIYNNIVPIPNIRTFARHLWFAKNCEKILSTQKFDIINGMSRIWYQDVYRSGDPLFIYWLKSHKPNIIDRVLGAINPKQKTMLSIEKRVFNSKMLRKVIAISELDRRLIKQYYNIPEEKIKVIYNGVNMARFNPSVSKFRQQIRSKFGISEKSDVALFAGLDFKRKGLASLIESVSLLEEKNDNLVCLIVGSNNYIKYQTMAKRLGIMNKIIFAGASAKVEEFYGAADFFVMPTLYDPFANVHLEALACGLPVITTSQAGGAELIQCGKNGFVIPSHTHVKELSEKILMLLNPNVRKKMSIAATKSVKDYSLESNARNVVALYEQVLEEKRSATSP